MKLYKLSAPSFNYDTFSQFLKDEGVEWMRTADSTDGEKLVESAGRICYMSFGSKQSPRKNSEYISNLIEQEHESVLEHANWTLLLTGISRAFSHQLVRHRIGFSFSQLSQQYHDESDATFIIPPTLASNPRAMKHWKKATHAANEAYRSILKECESLSPGNRNKEWRETIRRIRSDARSVLPNATETKIMLTANARSLRHFFEVRGSTLGDIECRQVSSLIFSAVAEDAPSLFQDFESKMLADGFPIVRRVTLA